MPIYEYQCENCGETAEVLQKFSDAPLSQCPACGGSMHKLMSMNSFQLKGNGWYVTDYAGKNGQSTPKKEGGEAASCDKASAEKSESPCKNCDKAGSASA